MDEIAISPVVDSAGVSLELSKLEIGEHKLGITSVVFDLLWC